MRSWLRRGRRALAVSVLWSVAALSVSAAPQLFFYPPPALYENGYKVYSPVTLKANQITTEFPEIPEMTGVGLIIYWSTICPQPNQYDFSIIDQALAYWGAKGKKVNLCVAQVGFPVRLPDGSAQSATPDWVLQKVATYEQPTHVIPWFPDQAKYNITATLPSFWDPKFVAEVGRLVSKLGQRYDGNPVLSEVRIATGVLGEDNVFSGLNNTTPGWTKTKWIGYCRKMTDLYGAAFHKTLLEFDEGWLGITEVYGTPEEQGVARAFSETLNRRHIARSFNGLDSEDFPLWQKTDLTGVTEWQKTLRQHMLNLREAHARGCSIKLEAIGPITGPEMQDIPAIARMVNALRPERVLFFDEVPTLLRHRQSNGDLLGIVPPLLVHKLTVRADQLLQLIGYPNP